MFQILSFLCYAFAIVDFGLYIIFDIDITGVSWSPIVAAVAGAILGQIGKSDD